MPDGPVTSQIRTAIANLERLCAERDRDERAVAAALEAALATAAARHAEFTAAATAREEAARAAAESACHAARAAAAARFDRELAALVRTTDAERAGIRERAEADAAKARKQADETLWMVETLYDSSKDKPREVFDATSKEIDAQAALARAAGDRAADFLAAAHLPPLPQPQAPETLGTAHAERAKAAVSQAQAAVTALEGLLSARAVSGIAPVVVVALLAAGGAAVGAWLNAWAVAPRPLGIGAALGAGLGVLAIVACFLRARAAGRARAQAAANAVGSALGFCEQWRSHAAAERTTAEAEIRNKRERESAAAKERLAAIRDELQRIATDRLGRIKEKRAAETDRLSAQRDAALAAADAQRERRLAEVTAEAAADAHAAAAALAAGEAAARAEHQAAFSALRGRWLDGTAAVCAVQGDLSARATGLFPAWDDASFAREADAQNPGGWRAAAAVPPLVPLGVLRVRPAELPGGLPLDERLRAPRLEAAPLDFPVPLELPDRCSLLIQTGGEGRDAALSVLQNTVMRVVSGLPPGKVRLTIIDPVGLGQTFAGLMHLADHDPLLVSDRIWTEPRHVESRLTDLTEHMENVIQKYLRNQFASIEEYNTFAGEVAEPYRFLVVADMPTNFNEIAAKRLMSIISSGARCGVYTLLALDTRQQLPQGITAQDLERAAQQGGVRLTWKRTPDGQPGLVWEDPDFSRYQFIADKPPAEQRGNAIVHMVGRASKDVGRVRVPFEMIAPDEAATWSMSTSADFRVALGRAGATRLQHLTLGRGTAQHALIAGRTGSGKSTLLHAIITNAALWYSPDEVELYLIDFKKGVEFKTYAAHELPHARVVAIESEREFGLSVLRRLDAELKRRGTLFRDASVQDLAAFRTERPDVRTPRVLLLVDEFQELFVEDDKLAQEAGLLLDRLVRQGRAFGMHVVLGSQTLGGAYSLAKATIGQMAVRIALACSEADAYLIMSDDNSAPRLLSRPGEAIYNDASGAVEGNSPFQVAWLPDEQRDAFLDRVQRFAHEGKARHPAEPTIVFEGSAPADLRRNHLLARTLDTPPSSSTAAPCAWLGDAVAIKDPTAATFRRQSAANLLIVGQRDESALAIMSAALIGLRAQASPATAQDVALPRFWVFDGTPADAPGPQPGFLPRVAAALGTGTPALTRVVEYRQVEPALAELAAELDRRQAAEAAGGAVGGGGAGSSANAPPVFLIIHGLQRFRMLRRAEDEFDFSSSSDEKAAKPDKLFARILREGPPLGLHTLVWCDTVASLNRTLDRQGLREFDARVLFQMSGADSSALIDAAVAGVIGQNRALFYSEEQGLIEKFRPYALPDEQWLAALAHRAALAPSPDPATPCPSPSHSAPATA
jgi:ABC-type multidrug transport system fused ATPase/permease subunit